MFALLLPSLNKHFTILDENDGLRESNDMIFAYKLNAARM